MARLEGHDDPKALRGMSQFFAAGLGGMISQSVYLYTSACKVLLTKIRFCIYPLDTLKLQVFFQISYTLHN